MNISSDMNIIRTIRTRRQHFVVMLLSVLTTITNFMGIFGIVLLGIELFHKCFRGCDCFVINPIMGILDALDPPSNDVHTIAHRDGKVTELLIEPSSGSTIVDSSHSRENSEESSEDEEHADEQSEGDHNEPSDESRAEPVIASPHSRENSQENSEDENNSDENNTDEQSDANDRQ